MMSADKKLKILIKENKGFITYEELKKNQISYASIHGLISQGRLITEERGIYQLPEVYLDEYYALQHRFSKGVFSMETALWLHGLTLTVPNEVVMTFPYGTNTKTIKSAGVKPVILRSNYFGGVMDLIRINGQKIKVYEQERVLAECLRNIYDLDVQIIAPAFKIYVEKGNVDYSKLLKYAKMFKVEKKVQSYLEVLV